MAGIGVRRSPNAAVSRTRQEPDPSPEVDEMYGVELEDGMDRDSAEMDAAFLPYFNRCRRSWLHWHFGGFR